eukprot:2734871-Rhodomonas_salina.1
MFEAPNLGSCPLHQRAGARELWDEYPGQQGRHGMQAARATSQQLIRGTVPRLKPIRTLRVSSCAVSDCTSFRNSQTDEIPLVGGSQINSLYLPVQDQ